MQLGLQDFGVQLKTVQMGPDVMASALEFKPDIIFIDVLLQKKSGYEVAHELKASAEFGAVPIVLMWSGFMEFSEEKAKATGAEGRLEKPFDSEILRNVTKDLVPRLKQHALSGFLSTPFISKPDLTKTSAAAPADPGSEAFASEATAVAPQPGVPQHPAPQPTTPQVAQTSGPARGSSPSPAPRPAIPTVPAAPKIPVAPPASVKATPVTSKPVAEASKAPRPIAEPSKAPRPVAAPAVTAKPVPSAAQTVKAFASQAPTPATSAPTPVSHDAKTGSWSLDDFPAPPVPGIDSEGGDEIFTSQPLAPLEAPGAEQPVAIELDAPWSPDAGTHPGPQGEPAEEWKKQELSDFTVNVPLDQLSGEVDVKINPNIDADIEFKTSVQQRFGNTGPGTSSITGAPVPAAPDASQKKIHPQVEKEMRARQAREAAAQSTAEAAQQAPPASAPAVNVSLSEDHVRQLVQTRTEALIKEMVQQIVPELATRLIQAEIDRLLSERGPD